jgi:exo-beta-1,3-glucanase (GH17 family)
MHRYDPGSLLLKAGAFALVLVLAAGCNGGGDGSGLVGDVGSGSRVDNPLPYMPIGVSYSALHASASPGAASIDSDLATTASYATPSGGTFSVVKTYYPQAQGSIDLTPRILQQKLGVVLGLYMFESPNHAWTDGDYATYVKPNLGNVKGVLVGNETMARTDDIVAFTLTYIDAVHADSPTTPVGTAQRADFWLAGSSDATQLAGSSDFIGANIYPHWNWLQPDGSNQPSGVTPQTAFDDFVSQYQQLVAMYPGKQIVVTETGWPTTFGGTQSSPPSQLPIGVSNAAAYFQLVAAWAASNKVTVFYYSMFDDWVAVDPSSPFNFHFGLLDTYRNPK